MRFKYKTDCSLNRSAMKVHFIVSHLPTIINDEESRRDASRREAVQSLMETPC